MYKSVEEQRLEFLAKVKELSHIYMEVDGFYYYGPRGPGQLSPHELRWIADELDRMNAPWEKKLDEYFGEQKGNDADCN